MRIASRVVSMYPMNGPIVESAFSPGSSRVAGMGLEYGSRDEVRVRCSPKPSVAIALHYT